MLQEHSRNLKKNMADEQQSSLQQVLDFLEKTLNVSSEVLDKFRNERVDTGAVSVMTSDELKEMGLPAKGDQVKLRAFCHGQDMNQDGKKEREAKLRKLKEIIEQGKSTRVVPKESQKKESTPTAKKPSKSTLKMEFRWKHLSKLNEFKMKRADQGGGVRGKCVSREAGAEDCLKEAQDLFFPGGKSSEGKLEDMDFQLADFKGDIISLSESFSPESYKQTYGLHTPRLILLSKNKIKEIVPIESSPESSSDEELMTPAWHLSDEEDPLLTVTASGSQSERAEPAQHSSLIGTTDERRELAQQIKRDYDASLANDVAKERQNEREEQKAARREELRLTRQRCTIPEPSKTSPHIAISVRHPNLGLISRVFRPGSKLLDVYNWVGSLASLPEHFSLTEAFSPSSILYPSFDASVVQSVLYVQNREDPIPLNQDERSEEAVGNMVSETHDRFQLMEDIQVTSDLPLQIMAEDDIPTQVNELSDRLERKRQGMYEKLQEKDTPTEISRNNCLKELLALYKQDDILQSKVLLLFQGEDAAGDGVQREVYAVFWDNFVTHYCEGVEQFAFILSPSLTLEDYVALGRIITHQFIQTGTIPLQLSEAILQQAVGGRVSQKCLVQSFLMLLHEKERDVVQRALLGTQPFPTDEIIEIFSDYNAGTVPNSSTIAHIVFQVANTELITKQFACIIKLREGMGSFWDGVSGEEINALYSCCTPTVSNVVACLFLESSTPQEEKVLRWLVRYLKNQDRKILSRFMRFCTGSGLVRPHQRIKVRMETMTGLGMRPKSRTCFGILTLPKNHHSYTHFSDNMDFYLHNPQVWDLSEI